MPEPVRALLPVPEPVLPPVRGREPVPQVRVPAPQALPQAVGMGSAAPQAEEGSAGASPAPQAVPQAEEAVFSPLPLQLNRFFNAIVNTSLAVLGIRGSPDPCCQYSGEECPPQVRTFL